jgi:NAD(P)-dependent dehydrogenase (short-subunit alcohol dehydrogenase family)
VPAYAAAETGQRCVIIRGDLAEKENSQGAVERAVTELGGLDLLVNNVATRSRGKTWPN